MRSLIAVVLLGCSGSPSSPPPAPDPGPDPAVLQRCPVGDQTHVAVYGFLVRELVEANQRDEGRAAVLTSLEREQAALAKPGELKPPSASLVEGETSHILSTMCKGTKGCAGIALYNRSGHAIALTWPHPLPVGFADEARWNALSRRAHENGGFVDLTCEEAQAARLACDGTHRLVPFAVYDEDALVGLAMCVVATGPRAAD